MAIGNPDYFGQSMYPVRGNTKKYSKTVLQISSSSQTQIALIEGKNTISDLMIRITCTAAPSTIEIGTILDDIQYDSIIIDGIYAEKSYSSKYLLYQLESYKRGGTTIVLRLIKNLLCNTSFELWALKSGSVIVSSSVQAQYYAVE